MENNFINASLSTTNLTFTPGTTPASFTVTVNNDSNKFANFQIEITAAGEQRHSDYRWYKLQPEVAAAKPPGSSTDFQVFITHTPIPGFVGTVKLTVRIFSPQLGQERRLLLSLKIERDNQPTVLSVELPVREFPVYPRNTVDIPVRIRNLGQQITNVVLRFIGIDSSWLIGNLERRFSLDPGGYTEITFQCQPPSVIQSPSQNYPFTIEATSNNGYPASAAGNLQVLPIGFVEFQVPEKQQTIPSKGGWVLDWKSDTATFELIFKNASNLYQEININLEGRDRRKITYKTVPETANLHLGETNKILLNVKTKRPWLGLAKTLLLEARSELFDQRLGTTDPASQSIELQRLPIIPLWLQLMVLGLIALLLALLLRQKPIMHTDFVNSVAFSGDGLSVISGSNDCTLRLWKINLNNTSLEPEKIPYLENPNACNKLHQPEGLLAITNDPVQVLSLRPVDNNRVAVGLDKGVIELRDVPRGNNREILPDQRNDGDRVFDLVFTQDSRFLFSGHAIGKVRIWSRPSVNDNFQPNPQIIDLSNQLKLPFQVRALTLSPDDQTLVIAGNFKRFLFGEFHPSKPDKLGNLSMQILENTGRTTDENAFIWALDFVSKPSKSNAQKILATSDSAGYITIWDLNQCQPINKDSNKNTITQVQCTKLDDWQASEMPVATLKFSEDGRLLVSGGDDGKVMVWYLTESYQLDQKKAPKGKLIYTSRKRINSVDLKNNMIVSGDEDFQVKLFRIE